MNTFKREVSREESNRDVHLRAAKEAVCVRRQKVSQRQAQQVSIQLLSGKNNASTATEEQLKHTLKEYGGTIDFFFKIQRLMGKKCSELEQEHSTVQYDNHLLRKRIAGYQAYLETTEHRHF